MNDYATADYFQPRAEQATLFDNRVTHLAEPPTTIPDEKIKVCCEQPGDVREQVKRRKAAKRAHGEWFTELFGGGA